MREEKVPAVYILASKRHGTLYIGVTSDLCSRIAEKQLKEWRRGCSEFPFSHCFATGEGKWGRHCFSANCSRRVRWNSGR